MSKQHKSWRGCCMLCAWAKGSYRGNHADRVPWAVKRQLGTKRRLMEK